jgi:DNA-binding NtrC family response regulator
MPPSELPRVLVVDDQCDMAQMIAEHLSDRGYAAVAESSPRKAVEMLSTQRFDVLVTDLRMPDIDGITLLRISRELDPKRPVIMLTAHSTVETAVEATGRGAYHYLIKPFRLDLLFRLIEQSLAVPR